MAEHIESVGKVFHFKGNARKPNLLQIMHRETGAMIEIELQAGIDCRAGVRHDPRYIVNSADRSIYDAQGDVTTRVDPASGDKVRTVLSEV